MIILTSCKGCTMKKTYNLSIILGMFLLVSANTHSMDVSPRKKGPSVSDAAICCCVTACFFMSANNPFAIKPVDSAKDEVSAIPVIPEISNLVLANQNVVSDIPANFTGFGSLQRRFEKMKRQQEKKMAEKLAKESKKNQ